MNVYSMTLRIVVLSEFEHMNLSVKSLGRELMSRTLMIKEYQ